MEIKETNLMAAYNTADENGKQLLKALFPDMIWIKNTSDNRPVTERIKTFDDACNELGEDHIFVKEWRYMEGDCTIDLAAYLKLRIICAALNEGWEPKFIKNEWRYYPWFCLHTQLELDDMDEDEKQDIIFMSSGDYFADYAGLVYAYSVDAPSYTGAIFGSRLCLKTRELATYCGKQFIGIWADYYLIRK